jgi:hypothetical protein
MHYRLAEIADSRVDAIRTAVTSALAQVDSVRRDTGRLQKTQCCA